VKELRAWPGSAQLRSQNNSVPEIQPLVYEFVAVPTPWHCTYGDKNSSVQYNLQHKHSQDELLSQNML